MNEQASTLPVEIELDDLVTRGTEWGDISVRMLRLPAGTDFTPLLTVLAHLANQLGGWGIRHRIANDAHPSAPATTPPLPVTLQVCPTEADRHIIRVMVDGDGSGDLTFPTAGYRSAFLAAVTGACTQVEEVGGLFTPWTAPECDVLVPADRRR
jgi:hypothetical protein